MSVLIKPANGKKLGTYISVKDARKLYGYKEQSLRRLLRQKNCQEERLDRSGLSRFLPWKTTCFCEVNPKTEDSDLERRDDLNLEPSDVKTEFLYVNGVQFVYLLYRLRQFSTILSNQSIISIPTAPAKATLSLSRLF